MTQPDRDLSANDLITPEVAALARWLHDAAEPLPPADAPDFGGFFDRFGDARIVLLGEATHGTHEFYAARAATPLGSERPHGAPETWPFGL